MSAKKDKATEAPETDQKDDILEGVEAEDQNNETVSSNLVGDDETIAEVKEVDPTVLLKLEVANLKDQLLRALAETENLRKRGQREREDAARYAAVPLIKDLIGVADNLRRAIDSTPADLVEENEQMKTLLTGVEMTEKELLGVFERHQIEKIDPLGQTLDPHFHEALFEVPDPNTPAGTVVQVIQAGYRLRDRLLRPAQVGVAKGGPAAVQVEDSNAANPGDSIDTTA